MRRREIPLSDVDWIRRFKSRIKRRDPLVGESPVGGSGQDLSGRIVAIERDRIDNGIPITIYDATEIDLIEDAVRVRLHCDIFLRARREGHLELNRVKEPEAARDVGRAVCCIYSVEGESCGPCYCDGVVAPVELNASK